MKKWWMKGLAVALCAGMLAPAAAVSVPGIGMTVYAEPADPTPAEGGSTTEDKITNEKLLSAGKKLGIPVKTGRIHSGDVFYYEDGQPGYAYYRNEKDCLCVEMESFALFHNAKVLGRKAACILTISDSLVTHEVTTSEERQNAFTNMMKVALEAAVADE